MTGVLTLIDKYCGGNHRLNISTKQTENSQLTISNNHLFSILANDNYSCFHHLNDYYSA